MENANNKINDLQKKNEKYQILCQNKTQEINDWIVINFKKEKKKRELFQENVMNILKETCKKLSDDFYKDYENDDYNDNIEYEENEHEL